MGEKPFYKEWAWQAICAWGSEAQANMVIEECSELILALVRYPRGRTGRSQIIEEMVDVSLMIEQLREMFEVSQEELDKLRHFKLANLTTLIDKAEITKSTKVESKT